MTAQKPEKNQNGFTRQTTIIIDGSKQRIPATGKYVGTYGCHYAAASTDIIRPASR